MENNNYNVPAEFIPQGNGDLTATAVAMSASESAAIAMATQQKAKLDEKDAQDRKTEFENRIKLYMGDATAIKGVCTWKNNKDIVKTDWEQVASVALASMSAEDKKKLIASYTKTKPGARVLRITAKGY